MDTVIWGRQGAKLKMELRAVSKRLQGRQTCSARNNNNTTNVLNRARVHRSWCDTRTLSHLHKRHTHTHTLAKNEERIILSCLVWFCCCLVPNSFANLKSHTHTHTHTHTYTHGARPQAPACISLVWLSV